MTRCTVARVDLSALERNFCATGAYLQQEALLKLKRRMLRNGIDRDSVF